MNIPSHVHVDDNGRRVFAECLRCENYIKVWANEKTRRESVVDFIKKHQTCHPERFIPIDRSDDDTPYFATDEDRCPPMGLQGAVLRSWKILG